MIYIYAADGASLIGNYQINLTLPLKTTKIKILISLKVNSGLTSFTFALTRVAGNY